MSAADRSMSMRQRSASHAAAVDVLAVGSVAGATDRPRCRPFPARLIGPRWPLSPSSAGGGRASELVLDLLTVGDLALVDADRKSTLRVRADPCLENHGAALLAVVR